MSKREVKIAAVEWAMSALLAVDAVDKEECPCKSLLRGFF